MRYTSAKSRQAYTFDAELEMKDAELVAADAAWTVDSAAAVIDVGTGRVDGKVIVDVSALEIATGDERYSLIIQGSNSATFASGIVILACLPVGDGSTIGTAFGGSGVDTDDSTGRYEIAFSNERNNSYYRYIRGWTDVAGTIATGINFSAYMVKN